MVDGVWWAVGAAILFFLLWRHAAKKVVVLEGGTLSNRVKYGLMSEQFMPLTKPYPYDPSGFRFLGSPIDGVQFTPNEIIIMEFKTGEAQMTDNEKNIKSIIENHRVRFEEIRLR